MIAKIGKVVVGLATSPVKKITCWQVCRDSQTQPRYHNLKPPSSGSGWNEISKILCPCAFDATQSQKYDLPSTNQLNTSFI